MRLLTRIVLHDSIHDLSKRWWSRWSRRKLLLSKHLLLRAMDQGPHARALAHRHTSPTCAALAEGAGDGGRERRTLVALVRICSQSERGASGVSGPTFNERFRCVSMNDDIEGGQHKYAVHKSSPPEPTPYRNAQITPGPSLPRRSLIEQSSERHPAYHA